MDLAFIQNKVKYYRSRLGDYSDYLRKASRNRNPLLQVFDVVRHKIKINTSPIDYYRFEFYLPDKSWEEKLLYVGKRGSTYYPYERNSVEYYSITENKYIFKSLLRGFDLPQPDFFFSIGPSYEVTSLADFIDAMNGVRSGIVFKPIDGTLGEGIHILEFSSGNFINSGEPISPEEIWELISNGQRPYLAEEKVIQHSQYRELNPNSLNTYRIIIIKLDDGELYVARTSMRIGQGEKNVDNLAQGGISLAVDRNGTSFFAYDWTAKEEITHHPDTKASLIGNQMAMYDEVVSTALRASEKFGFLGTTGWDIGVSESGPVVIEGNMFYDCAYNQIGRLGPLITPAIQSRLKKRHFGQAWDKTRIHPNVNRYRIKA